jgi:hypothetical protein
MSVLDLQRKGQQIGRIRIGQQVPASNGNMRPARLGTFRITTASRHTADAVAELFGGEVREWNKQWEVITGRSEISVMVPPRDAVVSQWYEMWNAGGCIRRCDSQHEQVGNGPCLCPHAEDPQDADEAARMALRRADMAKMNPPQACHLITRVNLMIPDLPGLGVFRLDTGSFYAAAEIGDTADLMQAARDQGVFLAAVLRIEQRQRVAGGQTKKYPVPVLEILSTFRQIVGGELAAGGMAGQLPPAPGEQRRAIGAAPQQQAPEPAPAAPVTDEVQKLAQQVAEDARKAFSRPAVRALIERAKAAGCLEVQVCVADTWMDLKSVLTDAWEMTGEGGGT